MSNVILKNCDACPAKSDLRAILDLIFFAVGHFYQEGNSFIHSGRNSIARHNHKMTTAPARRNLKRRFDLFSGKN
jgi:hypothetical protein